MKAIIKTIIATFLCSVASATESRVDNELIASLGIPASAEIAPVISYKGLPSTNQYAFEVFRAKTERSVYYIFTSAVIDDFVEYKFDSRKELLEFFILRFRGIANDLAHGRRRDDIGWPKTKPERTDEGLRSLLYVGYAAALQRAGDED